jgi:FMN phosphatase YigB (HAD superfamily)
LEKRSVKIVSDFDGVITELDQEGARCGELFLEKLVELVGGRTDEVKELLARVDSIVAQDSTRYGWRKGGRLSAFGDEDLFIRNIAAADLLDQPPSELDSFQGFLADLREAIAHAGFEDFDSVAGWAYHTMVAETAASAHKPLEDEAVSVLRKLLERGDEVVVVSNSGTDRILEMFSSVNLESTAYPTREAGKICVRGGARKYDLGETEQPQLRVGERGIDTNRPSYREILLEEKPDVVVGDVFSLDLALPLHLATTGELKGLKALLRKRAYTPTWSEDFCRSNPSTAVIERYSAVLEQ